MRYLRAMTESFHPCAHHVSFAITTPLVRRLASESTVLRCQARKEDDEMEEGDDSDKDGLSDVEGTPSATSNKVSHVVTSMTGLSVTAADGQVMGGDVPVPY